MESKEMKGEDDHKEMLHHVTTIIVYIIPCHFRVISDQLRSTAKEALEDPVPASCAFSLISPGSYDSLDSLHSEVSHFLIKYVQGVFTQPLY